MLYRVLGFASAVNSTYNNMVFTIGVSSITGSNKISVDDKTVS